MTDLTFEKFPSIKRLKRECVITEKLDGTNAQINFDEFGSILCGSRKRVITPDDDNYGFAKWAHENKDDLFSVLGEGRHYGEWWGQGIQRRYGLEEKRFSLFNTHRWGHVVDLDIPKLSVVPVLYSGLFNDVAVDVSMRALRAYGSSAAPGYQKPEGIVVYHSQIDQMFKVTFEHDESGKPQ